MLVLRSITQESSVMQGPHPALGLMSSPDPSRTGGASRAEKVELSAQNLYIKGLPPDTTDLSLKQMCQGYGTILSTKAVLDTNTNRCKGFGFVDFESAECAQKALIDIKNNTNYQVGYAKKQEQAETNVFFKNLPFTFTKEELENLVKECGTVSSAYIMTQNGRSIGQGFTRMSTKAECERVIKKYNNFRLPGGSPEPLLVKFADVPNRSKSNYHTKLLGHELQNAVAYSPSPYIYAGPPPHSALALGAPTAYPDNSVSAMMAAQGMAPMPAALNHLHMMAMPAGMPMQHAPAPHQYVPTTISTTTTLAAAAAAAAANGYAGYLSMAPAAQATYPTLPAGAQYGAGAELQLHQPTAAHPPGSFYVSSATGIQQMMTAGLQPTMDPTISGMAQWQ